MVIPNRSIITSQTIDTFCDRGMIYSICILIFVLPASIALLDSFAALAVFFYLIKKISHIVKDWPAKTADLNLYQKACFFWNGFAPPVNFLNRPLQILSLAMFISVLFSQYPALSFYAYFGKFIKCVFIFFSFIEAFSDERRIWFFFWVFLCSAFITALSGAFQHYTGIDFIKGHIFGHENYIPVERVNSSFFSANGFGAFLLPVIGLVGHLLFTAIVRTRSWILGAVFSALLVLFLACLCWTYSRSAWVGFLCLLFVTILLDRRKALFTGALLLIFIFIFTPSLNNVRHMHLINDEVESVQQEVGLYSVLIKGGSGRGAYWKKAVSIIRSSPVWGTGLNTYTRIIKKDPDTNTWRYAHNCYLQMTAETGLLGLFCFLWMIFVLLWDGSKYCGKIKGVWPLSFLQGALAGLSGFLVQCFFDNTLYTVELSVLMWVVMGLIVAVVRLKHP